MPLRSALAAVALLLASGFHAAGADRTDSAAGPGARAMPVVRRPAPCTRPGASIGRRSRWHLKDRSKSNKREWVTSVTLLP